MIYSQIITNGKENTAIPWFLGTAATFGTNWKFDSTTKFYICSDLTGQVSTSCFIQSFVIWNQYWNETPRGKYFMWGNSRNFF